MEVSNSVQLSCLFGWTVPHRTLNPALLGSTKSCQIFLKLLQISDCSAFLGLKSRHLPLFCQKSMDSLFMNDPR